MTTETNTDLIIQMDNRGIINSLESEEQADLIIKQIAVALDAMNPNPHCDDAEGLQLCKDTARALQKTRSCIEGHRKSHVKTLKELPKKIDANGRKIRLAIEVWEAEIKGLIDEHKQKAAAEKEARESAAHLKGCLAAWGEIEAMNAKFDEDREAERARQREAEELRAENERLREERQAQELLREEREEEQKRRVLAEEAQRRAERDKEEAEARALQERFAAEERMKAQAKQAEARRIAAEERARERAVREIEAKREAEEKARAKKAADESHRKTCNLQVYQAIWAHPLMTEFVQGVKELTIPEGSLASVAAKTLMRLAATGDIPRLKIDYAEGIDGKS